MNEKPKLYLIPSPLGDNPVQEVVSEKVLRCAASLEIFVVEQVRTARRVLSRYGLKGRIDSLEFHELNEHTTLQEVKALLELFKRGSVGLISEAGLPAVADPGALLVDLCHRNGISVVPLVGPSSLMMALMSSGLNGQKFTFNGYLSAKTEERRKQLRELEKTTLRDHCSQLFIETPYRNDALFADILSVLSTSMRVCVAADITLESEFILCDSVQNLRKKQDFKIGKRPCVFIISESLI